MQLISNADLKLHFKLNRQLIPINKEHGKRPLHNNWTKKQYSRKQIRQYARSGFNLGWQLGPFDLVIDIDKKSGGLESFASFLEQFDLTIDDLILEYPTVVTGGGGLHFYMKHDLKRFKETFKDLPGVEFKTKGRQVVLPGSLHPDTKQLYLWAKLSPYTEQANSLPKSLREWLLNPSKAEAIPGQAPPPEQPSELMLGALELIPVENFRNNADWFNLMASYHYTTNGKGLDKFLEWSIADPMYADQASTIRSRWKSLSNKKEELITEGLFYRTVQESNPKAYQHIKQQEAKLDFEEDSKPVKKKSKKQLLAKIKKLNRKTSTKVIEAILKQAVNYSALDKAEVLEAIKAHTGKKLAALREALKQLKKDVDFIEKKEADEKELEDLAQQAVTLLLENKFAGGEHLMHFKDQRFWFYDKTHWKRLERNILLQYLLETCNELKKEVEVSFQTSVLMKQAEFILTATVASTQDLFRLETGPPSIINTKNCEIHVDPYSGKFEIKPHRPESFLTACSPAKYDPDADCPLLIQTLEEIFDNEFPDTEDIIRHLFELFGYILQPRKDLATWVLFQGIGANGKTLILELLSAILGEAALEKSINELDPVKYTHAFQDLPGKLVVIDEDVKAQTLLPDDTLKKLSENKTLTANPKYSPMFKFRSTATIILASNSYPQTRDLSDGIKRRAMVIPFTRQFRPEEMDTARAQKIIDTELSGVLNMFLKGYARLRKRGRFLFPNCCKLATEVWSQEANPFNLFIQENYRVITGKKVKLDEIWNRYQIWSVDNSIGRSLSKTGLRRALNQSGYMTKRSTGGYIYVKGLMKR
jgi:P4 family phage/plasmid primase-like protien